MIVRFTTGPWDSGKVARVGFEPTASLGLKQSGLPVAYRAERTVSWLCESAMRESNPPIQGGNLAPRPLGQWHVLGLSFSHASSQNGELVVASGDLRSNEWSGRET